MRIYRILLTNNTESVLIIYDKKMEEICMKKLVALLMTVVMALSLCACGGNGDAYTTSCT